MKEIDSDWVNRKIAGRRGVKARLAEHLGIEPYTMSRLLAGRRQIQQREALAIIDFFEGKDDKTDELSELRSIMNRLSPERQKRILDFVRFQLVEQASEQMPEQPADDPETDT